MSERCVGPGGRRRRSGRLRDGPRRADRRPAAAGAAAGPGRLPSGQVLRRRHRAARLRRAAHASASMTPRRLGAAARLRLDRGGATVERTMARPVWVIPRDGLRRPARGPRDGGRGGARAAPGPRGATHAGRRTSLDDRFRARVLVGADGAHSVVAGLGRLRPARRALAIRGYAPTPPPGGDRSSSCTGTAASRRTPGPSTAATASSNVGYGELLGDPRPTPPSRRLLLDQLERAAARRGRGRRPTGAATTCRCRGWRWRQPDGPLLLAGDAAGLVNPMTGEGIYYAVATGIAAGRAAARALRAGDPARGRRGCTGPSVRRLLARAPAAHLRSPPRLSTVARRRRRRHPGRGPRPAGLRRPRRDRSRPAAASPAPGRRARRPAWPPRHRAPVSPRARGTSSMQILSVRGALPEHRYAQEEITDAFADVIARGTPRRAAAAPVPRQRRRAAPAPRAAAGGVRRAARLRPAPTTTSSRSRCELGAQAVVGRPQGRRPDPGRRRPRRLHDRHRARRTLPRRADRRRHRAAAGREAGAAGRARLRRRRRRRRPAARLPASATPTTSRCWSRSSSAR